MITSLNNGKIKYIKELMKKPASREKEGCFVAEGVKMFLEAPVDEIRGVYLNEHLYERLESKEVLPKKYENCKQKLCEISYEVVSDRVYESMTGTVTPQGIMTVVSGKKYSLEQILKPKEGKIPLYVILENLQDPGNLGTILRSSEAAGVDGILLSDTCVDFYNPKVIRSTMGAIFRVPFLYLKDLEKAIEAMKEKGIQVLAATLSADSKAYDQYKYDVPTAFLIGNEGNGLQRETIKAASAEIYIPMLGEVESLNASVAASVLMFEAARQRRNP